MAITQDEMQSIVSAVLSAIRTNSLTIDQLTPVTSLSDNDSFEINGGRRVPFALLRELIIALESETRSKSIAELNKRLNLIIGESVSDAIDNYNEIISFLEGIKDDEKLYSMILALQQAVWPLTMDLNVSPKTIEVGKKTGVISSYDVKRDGLSVLPDSAVTWDSPSPADVVSSTFNRRVVLLEPTAPGTTVFELHAIYQGMTASASAKVTAVYPSYFGLLAAGAAVTEEAVKAMTKLVNPSKSFQQTDISLANQRICLAYPKSFGTLTSVKDGNNFETLTAYTRSELAIGDVEYYVYTMIEPVTATGVTQIYS